MAKGICASLVHDTCIHLGWGHTGRRSLFFVQREALADVQQRVPPPISIPFKQVCEHLELPTVATYAGVCLWNWKPIFDDESVDALDNLSTLATFTGSLDESWFYLVSVAIEARGGPTIPLMLDAIQAVRNNDSARVTACLQSLAERLDDLGALLQKMYENCDPHVFYHRIRPFLAGSKNMAEAGLPKGVCFDTGNSQDQYVQFGGGSNAQSSLIQFFDIVLGVEHRPTGTKPPKGQESSESDSEPTSPPSRHNFIHDMRDYMPGPHRRFLEHVSSVANIREYVEARGNANRLLAVSYNACLAMLRSLRDIHIRMVSRFIVIKSRESRSDSRSLSPRAAPTATSFTPLNIASASNQISKSANGRKKLTGTGGTALIPFLKQVRDEAGEPAVQPWAQKLLKSGSSDEPRERRPSSVALAQLGEHADGVQEVVGLGGVWRISDSEGGLCHW